MTERTARTLAWGSFAAAVALTLVGAVYLVLGWSLPREPTLFGPRGYALAFGPVFVATGAVLASRRPANPIGWIVCGAGVFSAVQGLGEAYAEWGLIGRGGRSTLAVWGAWLVEWLWMVPVASLGVIAAIYPDGRWLSAGWRRAIVASLVLTVVSMVVTILTPELVMFTGVDNPTGLGGMDPDEYYRVVGWASGLFLFPVVVGAASAVVRFRRSRADERQQLKWLALSAALICSTLATYIVAFLVVIDEAITAGGHDLLENLIVLSFLTLPVAIAIGVMKYRLYDIDLVISKTLIYGALALFITSVYVALVVGVGTALHDRGHAALSAIAAALVALAFQPARRRAQHLANRLVYGKRATPYEVLSDFTERLGEAYAVEDVLPRLARILGEGVGAERVGIWLTDEGRFAIGAVWPTAERLTPVGSLDALPGRSFEVRHRGELLGAVSVEMLPNEPLIGAAEKLTADVAAQAGLVLQNVALVEDLRASRKRIVAAQDDRARALERNIHDGAQQQLVALSVKARLAQQLAARDPARAEVLLEEIQIQLREALEDLRDLARGIYPPLLADKGLAEALEAQARKASVPIQIVCDGIGRYPPEIESTIYFCVLEALQNVAKYADASRATVRLSNGAGELRFEVSDDGSGFDPAVVPRGSGLQNMADRLAALGGALEVRSAPGAGTRVSGRMHPPSREGTP